MQTGYRAVFLFCLGRGGRGGLCRGTDRVEQLPEPGGAPAQPQIAEQRFHTGGPAVIRYFGVFLPYGRGGYCVPA